MRFAAKPFRSSRVLSLNANQTHQPPRSRPGLKLAVGLKKEPRQTNFGPWSDNNLVGHTHETLDDTGMCSFEEWAQFKPRKKRVVQTPLTSDFGNYLLKIIASRTTYECPHQYYVSLQRQNQPEVDNSGEQQDVNDSTRISNENEEDDADERKLLELTATPVVARSPEPATSPEKANDAVSTLILQEIENVQNKVGDRPKPKSAGLTQLIPRRTQPELGDSEHSDVSWRLRRTKHSPEPKQRYVFSSTSRTSSNTSLEDQRMTRFSRLNGQPSVSLPSYHQYVRSRSQSASNSLRSGSTTPKIRPPSFNEQVRILEEHIKRQNIQRFSHKLSEYSYIGHPERPQQKLLSPVPNLFFPHFVSSFK